MRILFQFIFSIYNTNYIIYINVYLSIDNTGSIDNKLKRMFVINMHIITLCIEIKYMHLAVYYYKNNICMNQMK